MSVRMVLPPSNLITITSKRKDTNVELALFSDNSLAFLLRWVHLLAGVTWIGLLYYFNFIQGEYFKAADGAAKTNVIQLMVPRALWWFRWGAMFTFLSGIYLIYIKHLSGMGIMIGAVLGIIMFLNVWLIIWPNQKTVIASANQVAGGGEPLARRCSCTWQSRSGVAYQYTVFNSDAVLHGLICAPWATSNLDSFG